MGVTAIHPGEHLAEELKALGMSAAALARSLDVPTNRITAILNRQRAILVTESYILLMEPANLDKFVRPIFAHFRLTNRHRS